MSKNLIVKDNALINASYNLDLIEQRIILLAVAQSRKNGFSLASNRRISMHISDYIDIYRVNGKSVYENIKGACATLFERQFTYMEKQEKGVRVAKSRWVSEVAYNDETSTIDVTFSETIIPLLSMLEKHFTSYELEEVADLSSKYSVRLYEILIAWRSQGKTPMLALEEIRYRLGISEKEYQILADFKKRVLDLAVNEINEKTDIQVSYEQHKAGRRIIGFTFSFVQKKAKKTTNKNNEKEVISLPTEPIQEVEVIAIKPEFQSVFNHFPIADQKAYSKQYSDEQISAIIERANEYLNDLKQKGKRPRAGAIYTKAFAENWGAQKLIEKQEVEKKKEAIRQEKQAKINEEKEREEKIRQSKKQQAEAVAIFEMLSKEEQEEILDVIENELNSFFKTKFIEKRRKGEPAHLDVMAMITLTKIIFGN